MQCVVAVDASGDYSELYEPVHDPLIARYLALRAKLPSSHARGSPSPVIHPLLSRSPLARSIYSTIPFAPNLTRPEFVPTRQLELLEILRDKFPNHRVLMSDFDSLPEAIEGVNAPVVQTRYAGEVRLVVFLSLRVLVAAVCGCLARSLSRAKALTLSLSLAAPADGPVHDVPRPAGLLRHLLPDRL